MSNPLIFSIGVHLRPLPDADVTALENEIDRVVYSLYNLTQEEIAIVEESGDQGD